MTCPAKLRPEQRSAGAELLTVPPAGWCAGSCCGHGLRVAEFVAVGPSRNCGPLGGRPCRLRAIEPTCPLAPHSLSASCLPAPPNGPRFHLSQAPGSIFCQPLGCIGGATLMTGRVPSRPGGTSIIPARQGKGGGETGHPCTQIACSCASGPSRRPIWATPNRT